MRWQHVEHGIRRVVVDGITYTATFYPGMSGMRGYWTVQESGRDYVDGNDWYESSWVNVRSSVARVVAQRREV